MKTLLLTLLFATNSYAADRPLLTLDSISPYLKCTVSAKSVEVEKKVGGIRFSKKTEFNISSDIESLIQTAFDQSSTFGSSKFVAYLQHNDGSSKSFNLNPEGSESTQGLIRFLNKICSE